jgi:hypothetical protein
MIIDRRRLSNGKRSLPLAVLIHFAVSEQKMSDLKI